MIKQLRMRIEKAISTKIQGKEQKAQQSTDTQSFAKSNRVDFEVKVILRSLIFLLFSNQQWRKTAHSYPHGFKHCA